MADDATIGPIKGRVAALISLAAVGRGGVGRALDRLLGLAKSKGATAIGRPSRRASLIVPESGMLLSFA